LRRRPRLPHPKTAVLALLLGLCACGPQSIESVATEQLRSGARLTGYPLQLRVDVSARSEAGAVRLLHTLQSKGFPVTYEVTAGANRIPSLWMVHATSGLLRDEQELETTFHLLMSIGRVESSGIAWTVQRVQSAIPAANPPQHP